MDRIEMSEKDELIRKIKNLAVDPRDYYDGRELLKLMAFYGVHGLKDLTVEQLEEYYNNERAAKTSKSGTT